MTSAGRVVRRGGFVAFLAVVLLAGAGAGWADPPERPVVVVNAPDQPVPVRVIAPAPQPFQRPFALDWADGEGFVTSTYQVPAGKRLVVEYASLSAYLPPDGQSIFVRILTTVGGQSAFHTLAVQKQEDYGVLKQFGAAHTVRIYADPGSTVQVSVGRVPFTSTANATVTLSGRLEDVP